MYIIKLKQTLLVLTWSKGKMMITHFTISDAIICNDYIIPSPSLLTVFRCVLAIVVNCMNKLKNTMEHGV